MNGRVLIVDDEVHQRKILREAVTAFGYEATETASPEEAVRMARFGHYDVLITDLSMPGMDGIELLKNIRIHAPTMSVVLVTAHGSIETAVEAMKLGAEDYALKPIELPAFELLLKRVFSKRTLVKENQILHSENALLKKELKIQFHLGSMLGKSDSAQLLMADVQNSLKLRTPVLILGEKGTGKEDVARMIHYNGPLASSSILFFDCASVPKNLLETQIFGEEEKIGVNKVVLEHPGLLEKAHKGTLVISGISHLDVKAQVKLFQASRDQKCQRIGNTRLFPSEFRLIVIEEPDEYERALKDGKIENEFYNLLAMHTIRVAPLRERKKDLPILLLAAVRQFEPYFGKKIDSIDPDVFAHFQGLELRGNVRELNELVREALAKSDGKSLTAKDFIP